MICEHCASKMLEVPRRSKRHVPRYRCPGCELYNAAVRAQGIAALDIARERHPKAKEVGPAWLNRHGIFANIDGVCIEVGTAKEAAPFVALTQAALSAGRISEAG